MAEQEPPTAARPLIAAGALFFDEDGRVLLVRPSYKPYWEIPGGYVEAGESPLQACIREVKEELGIAPPLARLLAVDWAPHPDQGDKTLFVFDGGVLSQLVRESIRLDAAELMEWAFHHSDALDKLLIPRLSRRLHAALFARAEAKTVYLENGTTPADGFQ